MGDVKWIRLATQIFDNRKIKQIEKMPDGDSIIVIWFKLLCLAGNVNNCGMISFTSELPYTEDMLATEFNIPQQKLQTLKLALITFQNFGMIEIIDNVFYISSWEKYQNVEGLEKIREQTKNRVAKHRENQKSLVCNVTSNANVTQCNAIELELEEDKEIDINIKKEIKHKFGEFDHVRLKESESNKLIAELGQEIFDKCIKKLDEYIQETGKKYKDHNLTIRRWVIEAVKSPNKPSSVKAVPKPNKFNNAPEREYTPVDMELLEKRLLNKEL